MDMLIPFITLIIISVLYWLFSIYFDNRAVVERKLKRIPPGNIMTCKDNDVIKVKGKVEMHLSSLTSPLSKKKCVYYQVIVEERQSRNYDKTIIHDEKAVDFFVSDGNKRIYISTRRVHNYLQQDVNYKSGFLNEPSDVLKDYLKRRGESSVDFFGVNRSIRYHEGSVEIGDTVTVAGKVKWVNGSKVGLPDTEKVLYMMAIDQKNPLYLYDDKGVI